MTTKTARNPKPYEPTEKEIHALKQALAAYGVHLATPSMREVLMILAMGRKP